MSALRASNRRTCQMVVVCWEPCQGTTSVVPKASQDRRASAPAMSKPSRPSSPTGASLPARTFFVTTKTAGARSLLQTERMASLMIDVLRSYVRAGKFTVHDFVVMPNHVHILLTVPGDMTIEKVVQLIKGNFSFRVGREFGIRGEIWQRGFSDVRINDPHSFRTHREYIDNNPVKAALAGSPAEFPFGSAYLKKLKRRGFSVRVRTTQGTCNPQRSWATREVCRDSRFTARIKLICFLRACGTSWALVTCVFSFVE